MEQNMQRNALVLFLQFCLLIIFLTHVNGETSPFDHHFHDQMRKMQAFKSSIIRRELASSPSPSPSPSYYSSPAPSPQVYLYNLGFLDDSCVMLQVS